MPVADSKTATRDNFLIEIAGAKRHTCACPDRHSQYRKKRPIEVYCHLSDGNNPQCHSHPRELHVLAFNHRSKSVDIVVDVIVHPDNWRPVDNRHVRHAKVMHIPLATSPTLMQGIIEKIHATQREQGLQETPVEVLTKRLHEPSAEVWRPILNPVTRKAQPEDVQVLIAFEVFENWFRVADLKRLLSIAANASSNVINHRTEAYGNGKVEALLA